VNPRIVILDVVAPALYWVILAVAGWLMLRGHNEPGGGFIASLVALSATVLWAVARDPAAAERRLPTGSPVRLAAVGVLLAAASGLPGLAGGGSYLSHLWWTLDLGVTSLKLSTVLVFDIGVALGVWGALAGYALGLLDVDPAAREDGP